MKRRSPALRSVWFGCGTIDGLNNAADSMAYSPVKNAPIKRRRLAERDSLFDKYDVTFSNCRSHDFSRFGCRLSNSSRKLDSRAATSDSVKERTRSMILLTRSGPA